MGQQKDTHQQSTIDEADKQSLTSRPELIGSEDIHLRNYDQQWGYDLLIEVVDEDGEVVFEKRYYLQPGRVENELILLQAGEYEIRATMDNLQEKSIRCRIDDGAEHTVVFEVGNGALSLTQGLNA